jgi:lysophospholipid acyltransferase
MIHLLDLAFAALAGYVGLSKDQLKLVTVLYAAVPLCGVLKRLPDNKPYLKNTFNIAYAPGGNGVNCRVSLFILVGVFDLWKGLCILLVSAVGTYLLTFSIRSSFMPWIVFIYVMGIMSISHIIRQVYRTPDDVIDYTGSPLHPSLLTPQRANGAVSKTHRLRLERLRRETRPRCTPPPIAC